MSVSFTPEAMNDLYGIKVYLDTEYGPDKEKEILNKIIDDINRLTIFPDIDIKLFAQTISV